MKNIYTLWATLFSLVIMAPVWAQSTCAGLLKNIGKDKDDGKVSNITRLNDNVALFFAADEFYGRELWRTDGTEAGTYMVKDIYTGIRSSVDNSDYYEDRPIVLNGVLFFIANDGVHGNELWRSDGTDAGTYMLVDIYAGSSSSISFPYFKIYKNALYFWAYDRLYRTEGTTATTTLVKADRNLVGRTPFVDFQGQLWFGSYDYIWRSDGTTAGTVQAVQVPSLSEYSLAVVNDKLYYEGNSPVSSSLYMSDGTPAGSKLVRENVVGYSQLWGAKGLAYFIGRDNTLWRSDGTLTGTYHLTTVNPEEVFVYKDELYFTLTTTENYRKGLIWKTDGTVAGTKAIIDITPEAGAYGYPVNISEQDGYLYFFSQVGSSASNTADQTLKRQRWGFWRSDGTAAGTRVLCPINDNIRYLIPQRITLDPYYYYNDIKAPLSTLMKNYMLFVGLEYTANGSQTNRYGAELYRSDLTNCPAITATLTGTAAFCPGSNAVFAATATGGTAPYAYRWQQGTTVVGTGAASLTVNAAGTYTLTATDANGCAGTAQVTATQRPAPTVSLPAAASFCAGQSVVLTATGSSGTSPYTYAWKQGTTAVGTSAATLSVNAGGTYAVTVTDAGGCASGPATATVTQRPSPTATITASAPGFTTGNSVTLTANTGTGLAYQWTRDGQPIAGATQVTYVAQQPGNYGLVVLQDGCSATATATQISLITAIDEPQTGPDFTLTASPNPSPGAIQVRIVTQPGRILSVTITLRDLTGRSLLQKQISVSGQHTEQLDLATHPAATYLINAVSDGQQSTLRLLRQ